VGHKFPGLRPAKRRHISSSSTQRAGDDDHEAEEQLEDMVRLIRRDQSEGARAGGMEGEGAEEAMVIA
jgi:high-affinity K+ transport system ATPase subunit B